jgi:hypothetical protein
MLCFRLQITLRTRRFRSEVSLPPFRRRYVATHFRRCLSALFLCVVLLCLCGVQSAIRATRVSFIRCEVAHVGQWALWFGPGATAGVVDSCLLSDMGIGGIRVANGAVQSTAHAYHLIQNNVIRAIGRIDPVHSFCLARVRLGML